MQHILIIDDNEAIHSDFKKILAPAPTTSPTLAKSKSALFGSPSPSASPTQPTYDVSFASQGEQGLRLLEDAVQRGEKFALAFVDMRMPPGWDGLQTIERLWQADPDLQVVICS